MVIHILTIYIIKTTIMKEKTSLNALVVWMIVCVAFPTCHCEEINDMRSIRLKFEQLDQKIEFLQNRDIYLTKTVERQQNTIQELQTALVDQQQTINQHEAKIKRQEEAIHRHDSLLSDSEKREQQHHKVVALLKRTVATQGSQIKRVLSQFASTVKKLKTSGIAHNRLNSTPVTASVPNKSMVKPSGITQLYRSPEVPQKRLVLKYEGPIAFTATLTNNLDNLGINQSIVFDNVILNLGNGYHNLHGIFNVPQNGLYVISASLLFDNKASDYADAFITHNGKDIAGLLSHGMSGNWDHSSQTVVIQANQGDEVWVRNENLNNTSVFGSYYSSFTGYLLYSM